MLTKDQLQVPMVREMFDLARRIVKGERQPGWIEPETIQSAEYRKRVAAILKKHGLLESSGGPAFFNLIRFVPNPRVGEALCDIALDEVRHGRMLLECLDPLGEEYRDAFRNIFTEPSSDARLRQVGMRQGRRDPESWADVLAFTMLIDPAGILIVGARLFSNYGPLSRASARTLLDEEGHAAFWEKWGQDLLASPEGRREVQDAVDRILPTALGTLGRPKAVNPEFAREQALGIWRDDPLVLQDALREMLKLSVEPAGLVIRKDTQPNYSVAFW